VVVVCDKAGAVLRTESGTDRSLPDPRTRRPRRSPRHGRSVIRRSSQPPRDPTASTLDRQTAARLQEAAEVVGVRFLDHVVVTDNAWQRVTADP
jgi:DNA repair protein RadC